MPLQYNASDVFNLGEAIASTDAYDNRDKNKRTMNDRTFIAFYGRDKDSVLEIWERCWHLVPKTKLKHLLWTLMYMKLYLPIDVMIVILRTSKDTLNSWVWRWITVVASLRDEVILWGNRHRNVPDDVFCQITVDGTDFQIGEPFPFNKKWKSPKLPGGSVKYEVAVSIYAGDIVWIYGPHNGGKNDLTIFREELRQMLEPGEMIEADAGYKGDAEFIRNRDIWFTEQEKREKSELRARHETVNRRFKQWGILKQQFRNGKEKHQMVFFCIAVLTQLDIDNGNVLFSCEPKTRKTDVLNII